MFLNRARKHMAALGTVLAWCWLAVVGIRPAAAELRAGAAKSDITPDLAKHGPVYLAGFGHNRIATGVHDHLWARCVALWPARKPLVICAVDSIGLFLDDVERARRLVPNYDLVIASTHDHEAPDTMGLWGPEQGKSGINDAYNTFVVERVAEAARAAVKALKPVNITLARVQSPELDSLIRDTRPPEVHDSELVVLALADEGGQAVATIVNWANHPETLGSGNTLITADFPGELCAALESQLGGVGVLWNGAVGGTQSPLGTRVIDPKTRDVAPDNSFRKAELIGRRVADLALGALQGEKPVDIVKVTFDEQRVSVPVTNAGFDLADKAGVYKGRKARSPDGSTTTPVGLIRLSDRNQPVLEIALIPGELYPELSVGGVVKYEGADFPDAPVEPAIKKMMTAEYRMLVGLADDEIGYIIPKVEWDEKPPYLQSAEKPWYGEVNSVGPDAAPRIVGAFRSLLFGPAPARRAPSTAPSR
jgi:hypothetical protein